MTTQWKGAATYDDDENVADGYSYQQKSKIVESDPFQGGYDDEEGKEEEGYDDNQAEYSEGETQYGQENYEDREQDFNQEGGEAYEQEGEGEQDYDQDTEQEYDQEGQQNYNQAEEQDYDQEAQYDNNEESEDINEGEDYGDQEGVYDKAEAGDDEEAEEYDDGEPQAEDTGYDQDQDQDYQENGETNYAGEEDEEGNVEDPLVLRDQGRDNSTRYIVCGTDLPPPPGSRFKREVKDLPKDTTSGILWPHSKSFGWTIKNYPIATENDSNAQYQVTRAVTDAFREWGHWTNFKFTEGGDDIVISWEPNVEHRFIRFQDREHMNCPFRWDGKMRSSENVDAGSNRIFAHAFYPPKVSAGEIHRGEIHVNDSDRLLWDYDLTCAIILHELGHTFGLTHSSDKDAVMWDSHDTEGGNPKHKLRSNDIARFQDAYGDARSEWMQILGDNESSGIADMVILNDHLIRRDDDGSIHALDLFRALIQPHVAWKTIDRNQATAQIAAGELGLFQRHKKGQIYRPKKFDYSSEEWYELDPGLGDSDIAISKSGSSRSPRTAYVYQLHQNGQIWRLPINLTTNSWKHTVSEEPGSWQLIKNDFNEANEPDDNKKSKPKHIVATGEKIFALGEAGDIMMYLDESTTPPGVEWNANFGDRSGLSNLRAGKSGLFSLSEDKELIGIGETPGSEWVTYHTNVDAFACEQDLYIASGGKVLWHAPTSKRSEPWIDLLFTHFTPVQMISGYDTVVIRDKTRICILKT
ncbi:hypothetical protein TWF506_002301 [Arthrobotrys conoides]|uniref:Peptidase metallopeptidase domain-containing protein n=1 Tax=Arthrobotrys conoides TaxID=74498 RepID=A0AAN8N6C4_9PEZI